MCCLMQTVTTETEVELEGRLARLILSVAAAEFGQTIAIVTHSTCLAKYFSRLFESGVVFFPKSYFGGVQTEYLKRLLLARCLKFDSRVQSRCVKFYRLFSEESSVSLTSTGASHGHGPPM